MVFFDTFFLLAGILSPWVVGTYRAIPPQEVEGVLHRFDSCSSQSYSSRASSCSEIQHSSWPVRSQSQWDKSQMVVPAQCYGSRSAERVAFRGGSGTSDGGRVHGASAAKEHRGSME